MIARSRTTLPGGVHARGSCHADSPWSRPVTRTASVSITLPACPHARMPDHGNRRSIDMDARVQAGIIHSEGAPLSERI